MKYSTVIFDVDGTLFDTSEGIFECIEYVVEKMNYPKVERSLLSKFIGPPVYESFSKICGMNEEDANIATKMYREMYVKEFVAKSKLYDSMEDLLAFLKENGVKVAIATMKTQPQIDKLLEITDMSGTFDSVRGADTVIKNTKADLIKLVLSDLGENPENAVMVGDTLSDGKGASIAKTDFIAVTYGFGITDEAAISNSEVDYVLCADSVNEIKDFLEN